MNEWSNQKLEQDARKQTAADEALLRDPDYWSNEPKEEAKRKKPVKKQRNHADNSRRN